MRPLHVYLCYASEDQQHLQALVKHLDSHVRAGRLTVWHRGLVFPGQRIQDAIEDNLRRADIILLLVSADLLASRQSELDQALDEGKRRSAAVVPILLRPALVAGSRLEGLRFLPADGKALTRRADRDEAWVDVLTELERVIAQRSSAEGTPSPAERQAAAPSQRGPIRILFLGATPSGSTRAALDQEVREIDQRLRLSEHRDRFTLQQEWAVNAGELSQLLLRHRPTLIHFGGSGGADGQLLLLDAAGKAQPVPRAALAQLFRLFARKGLRGVVLSACYSRDQAQEIVRHVDWAVGISGALPDQSALAFAAGFYSALGAGETLQDAHAFGCVQIGLMGLSEEDLPALLTRQGVDPAGLRLW